MKKLICLLASLALLLTGCEDVTTVNPDVVYGDTTGQSDGESGVSAEVPVEVPDDTSADTPADTTREDIPADKPIEKSAEQLRLERLVLDSIPSDEVREGYALNSVLFGDLDGDSTEELCTVYAPEDYPDWGAIWYACGDRAEGVATGGVADEITATPDGVFLHFICTGAISPVDVWYHIENGTAVCSQPEDNYSARIFYSSGQNEYTCEILGYDEEIGGAVYETHRLSFDDDKRQFIIGDKI